MRDGVHPTQAGYKIWRDALIPLLQTDKQPDKASE
jgi:lysophospholipase L1-like esterase